MISNPVAALFDAVRTLRKARRTLGWRSGGVYKRIDENRELLELLNAKAPEFVAAHPWIKGWLQSHDAFLTQLTLDIPIDDGEFQPASHFGNDTFPRPWPVINPD
jgi:hypothetical protein